MHEERGWRKFGTSGGVRFHSCRLSFGFYLLFASSLFSPMLIFVWFDPLKKKNIVSVSDTAFSSVGGMRRGEKRKEKGKRQSHLRVFPAGSHPLLIWLFRYFSLTVL